MHNAHIIIAGAGPVGLLASLLAAQKGISVILLDRNVSRPCQSRAIGITPPSLGILERAGLSDAFVSQGVCVSHSGGYTKNSMLGKVDFSHLKTKYPFVLALPQHKTEAILEEAVLAQPNIQLLYGYEITTIQQKNNEYVISGTTHDQKAFSLSAPLVLACDGGKSILRESLNIPFTGYKYPYTFLMADYKDNSGWEKEARLYFTSHGSVESFPLPNDTRRYVLRTAHFTKENTSDFLEINIPKRCNVSVKASEKIWESAFGVQRFLASSFALPGLFLCGDAAHLMSPIGGQNMNTGFADAELAIWLIELMLNNKVSAQNASRVFTKYRKPAARTAAMRAEMMMKGGTRGGLIWNALRNTGTVVALNSPIRSILYGMFTMLSIPNRDLPSCYPFITRDLAL